MRRKVSCTAHTATGQTAALLIARLDLAELMILGGPPALAEDLRAAAAALAYEPRIAGGDWSAAAGAARTGCACVTSSSARAARTRSCRAMTCARSRTAP